MLNEELHNVYSSQNIIKMLKSRAVRWVGHVAPWERCVIHTRFWWESEIEKDRRKLWCEDNIEEIGLCSRIGLIWLRMETIDGLL
jgi:hypothetical protein